MNPILFVLILTFGNAGVEMYTEKEPSLIACHDAALDAHTRITLYNDTHLANPVRAATVLCVDISDAKPVSESLDVTPEAKP